MEVTVVGAGYVGLVTGASLARIGGHRVTFVERSGERLERLKRGEIPIEEAGLREAFAECRDRIEVVADLEEALPTDIVLVAVGTPVDERGDSDVSQLDSVFEALSRWPDLHVSIRSTLPPGMSVRLPELLHRSGGQRISTNPEFLRQGSAMYDYAHPSRVVIGRFPETEAAHLDVLEELFGRINAPRVHVDVAAAELIKNVANGFLAMKLSFVNEVAALSEEYDVDVDEVLEGISYDPRIGSSYMRPGLGFGGSCLPKELRVLATAGERKGLPMHLARAAADGNAEQQGRFTRRLLRELKRHPSTIGMLGLSFKAGTDDLRDSPAVTVARRLLQLGHRVRAFDPAVDPARAMAALPSLEAVGSAEEAFADADAIVLATEWPEFRELDWARLRQAMRGDLLFDGRNLLEPKAAAAAGYAYRGVGRMPFDPQPDRSAGNGHAPETAASADGHATLPRASVK